MKKLNLKKLASENPGVDMDLVQRVREMLGNLRKQRSKRPPEFDLRPPFTRTPLNVKQSHTKQNRKSRLPGDRSDYRHCLAFAPNDSQ